MREILFRGKRFETQEWIEGDLLIDGCHDISIREDHCTMQYDIIPETVGQYTGLTDNNGKKIFEGDILEWDIEEWKAKGTNHGYRDVVKWDYELFDMRKTDWKEHCKIIGNTHDNPELLEVTE